MMVILMVMMVLMLKLLLSSATLTTVFFFIFCSSSSSKSFMLTRLLKAIKSSAVQWPFLPLSPPNCFTYLSPFSCSIFSQFFFYYFFIVISADIHPASKKKKKKKFTQLVKLFNRLSSIKIVAIVVIQSIIIIGFIELKKKNQK